MDEEMTNQESKESGESESQGNAELEELKAKCAEFENGWKRALADYNNLSKDLLQQKQQMRLGTIESVLESVLPVLDNFDQAVRFQPEGLDEKAQNWLTGIMHVRTQLEDVLTSFGAEPFGTVGDAFDPHTCEAVSERSEPDAGDQTILDVTQRGWKLGEKVIRPAKVIINNKETN